MSLKDVPLTELRAEIERRIQETRAKERERRRKQSELWESVLDAILAITPEHGRTSCADDNLCNSDWHEDRPPRCTRCFLLALKHNHQSWPDDLELQLSLVARKPIDEVTI